MLGGDPGHGSGNAGALRPWHGRGTGTALPPRLFGWLRWGRLALWGLFWVQAAFLNFGMRSLVWGTSVAWLPVLICFVTLLLLLGGVYLIWRGVIRFRIPVAYLGTVAVLCLLFPQGGIGRVDWMLYNLCGGGLMLGAFFMATDYVTSPVTKMGEIYFGIGCGLLTVFIRYFGGYPEGVSYAILIMNICVWLLDKAGKSARFGVTKEMKAKAKADKKAAKEG